MAMIRRAAVLRALSRYDWATTVDIQTHLGVQGNTSVWRALKYLVNHGMAEREAGGRERVVARFRITPSGRKAL